MTENEYGFDAVAITVAGIDMVQNKLGNDDPKSFYQQLVAERPEVAFKLGYWLDFCNEAAKKKGLERQNIRYVTFGLLEHVLNQFVEIDTDDSLIGSKTNE